MVGQHVVTAVDDVFAAVVGLVDIIGVLHQGQEGDVVLALVGGGGGDVEPVGIFHQLVAQGQGQHDGAHAFQLRQPPQIILWQGGGHAAEKGGRNGDQYVVKELFFAAHAQPEPAIFLRRD